MKSIIITTENHRRIFSKLEKFFKHKNIMNWHTFDCGMKKRISVYMPKDPHKSKRHNTTCLYSSPTTKRLKLKSEEYEMLVINLDNNSSLTIRIGDTISFLGNRIVLKQEWLPHSNYKYIYALYQIMGKSYTDPARKICMDQEVTYMPYKDSADQRVAYKAYKIVSIDY